MADGKLIGGRWTYDCHERPELPEFAWSPRPDGTEMAVRFTPGYNCRDDSMLGHGVHGMEILWVLRGPLGAVQFTLGTDWIPGALRRGHGLSPDGSRCYRRHGGGWSTDPRGYHIGWHSPTARYEGHEADGQCGLLAVPCYYDQSYSAADPVAAHFVADGESAVVEALEKWYAELGGDPDG